MASQALCKEPLKFMERNTASPQAGAEGSCWIINCPTLALWTRQIPGRRQSEGSPSPGAGARAAVGQLCPAAPTDPVGVPKPSAGPVPTGHSEQIRDFGTEGTIASQVPCIISRLCQANPIRGLFFFQNTKQVCVSVIALCTLHLICIQHSTKMWRRK